MVVGGDRFWHGHERLFHDNMALPTTFTHGEGRCLVAKLCARHVFHVVDHDDRHDDPERDPHDPALWPCLSPRARQGKLPAGAVPTFVFVLGYLLSWAAFSGAATGLQWGLERVALIHQMMMWSINPIFTAALLIAAGLYQLTPLKTVCLEHCRSPAQYLAQHFRPGAAGAFRLGWRHGAYCLGCCWFLMALLFAGGIMNLVWIAGLAVYVLIEKVAPNGQLIARMAGAAMVLVGLWVAAGTYGA